jgi:hypothetical protein
MDLRKKLIYPHARELVGGKGTDGMIILKLILWKKELEILTGRI